MARQERTVWPTFHHQSARVRATVRGKVHNRIAEVHDQKEGDLQDPHELVRAWRAVYSTDPREKEKQT